MDPGLRRDDARFTTHDSPLTLMPPTIILIRPQMGENIGAAARAMANFGLHDLRLVAPRDGWPNVKANNTSGHAEFVIEQAKLFATTAEAVADLQFTLATTARDRTMAKPSYGPEEAIAALRDHTAKHSRTGILFGPERTGLETEDLISADAILTFPTDPRCASLNLSHAVGLVAYEWSRLSSRSRSAPGSAQASPCTDPGVATQTGMTLITDHIPATKAELEGFFTHLESALDARDYWKSADKKPYMWRNIRTTLTRAGMSAQETQTWRGIIRALMGEG
jgi:tRNA/rRNA methyltransferase